MEDFAARQELADDDASFASIHIKLNFRESNRLRCIRRLVVIFTGSAKADLVCPPGLKIEAQSFARCNEDNRERLM
ncbi:MAG TPA: hypothetical protein VEX70_01145 [Pyrinomonadaceae bacterium]|jgi:hypothetical protein|nr:hypothetical protein [Pyrinomonadaceae bacterium]